MPLAKCYKAACDRCGATRLIDTQFLRDAEREVVETGWKHNIDDTLLCSKCVHSENMARQIAKAMRGET